MKRTIYFILTLLSVILYSCEDRIGYYDNEQEEIIARLTAHEWMLIYAHRQDFGPADLNEVRRVYKFNPDGTGSTKWIDLEDGTMSGEPVYFRWTFTNDSFAVLYIDKEQQFWLIDKLTSIDLWVYSAFQDPAIYPSPDKWLYKFSEYSLHPQADFENDVQKKKYSSSMWTERNF